MGVNKLECGSCKQEFSPSGLFICEHMDCDDDRKKYCCECGQFLHRVKCKSHPFDPDQNYIKCVDQVSQHDQAIDEEEEELKYNQQQCDICQKLHDLDELMQCHHTECQQRFKGKVYCENCIECIHISNKQGHQLIPKPIEPNTSNQSLITSTTANSNQVFIVTQDL